jgi:predicted dehydrogenase
LRIVLTGVSHWHLPFYLDPCLALSGTAVVGVSDPDPARAREVALRVGCPAFTDDREMCAQLQPDFAFVLGRHCDMAALGRLLIEARIAFVMEKPCGISVAEVADLADSARASGVFAAVPLVFRYCELLDALRDEAAGEPIQYASFKFIGGSVERYREARCEWMLNRATAGGGALINLGVHFLDLCRVLLPEECLEVVGATLSNANAGLRRPRHLPGGDGLSVPCPAFGL